MIGAYRAADGIDVVTSTFEVGGLGRLPVNAFVLHGDEPVLVDTGAVVQHEEFWQGITALIDPRDIRWIWLTHPDSDHTGTLHRLLAENPGIRVVTTFLGMGILSTSAPLPVDRVHLLNPGQRLTLGDRTLTAVKPPLWDNPATTAALDDRTGALFSSDCFGALLEAVPEDATDLPADVLRQGQITWATIDSPWVHTVDRAAFARQLASIGTLDPTMVLSSHLPAAPGAMLPELLRALEAVPDADPFVGPDQAALEQMLAQTAAVATSATSKAPACNP